MIAKKPLADYVSIARRYQRSTNVAADAGSSETIGNYIVSHNARDVALRVLRELGPEGRCRAWTILGPYGTGKSSFAAWLSVLLGPRNAPHHASAQQVFANRYPDFVAELDGVMQSAGPGLACAVVTGERAPLALLVLRAVTASLSGVSSAALILERAKAYVANLQDGGAVADSDVVAAVVSAATACRNSGLGGLSLIIDELGKVLEWAVQDPSRSDLYLLQLLAEAASRSTNGHLLVVTVVHQTFGSYAEGGRRAIRDELAKVEGRFEVVPFIESPTHLVNLVGHAIVQSDGCHALAGFADAQQLAKGIAAHYPGEFAEPAVLAKCFPLNPVVALVAGPLFRLKLGQNERSLFAFLGSREPCGFRDFLDETEASSRKQFTLSALFDYVVANTGVRFQHEAGERIWASVDTAIGRLKPEDPTIATELLKAIGILTAISKTSTLRADEETLSIGLGAPPVTVASTLDELCHRTLIVYRKFKRGYQIFDGSDLDVQTELKAVREDVERSTSLAKDLQASFPPMPLVATRHGLETGTMRYFTTRFVAASEVMHGRNKAAGEVGDGELLYVVPDNDSELQAALAAARGYSRHGDEFPTVYAFPRNARDLREAAVEYLAVVQAIKTWPQLDSDPVARRELAEHQLGASDALANALQRAFGEWADGGGAVWVYDKHDTLVSGRQSAAASAIFGKVFRSALHVRNELVNRVELSTAAAKARRQVLEMLVSSSTAALPKLGITGHPPELSIYLSVLADTGIHADLGDTTWGLRRNEGNRQLATLWAHLDKKLSEGKGCRQNLANLVDLMRKPPFGIREGVGLILLLVYCLTGEDELFVYEDGTLIPKLQADTPHRMLRSAKSFELQRVPADSAAVHMAGLLWDRLARGPRPADGIILRMVRGLMLITGQLSQHATTTQHVPESARKVRAAIRSARDPVDLLTSGLRGAVTAAEDPKPLTPEEVSDRVKAAVVELQGADNRLLEQVATVVGQQFAAGTNAALIFRAIASRAKLLAKQAEMSAALRRFVTVTCELAEADPADWSAWIEAVARAIVGKQTVQWTDEDLINFEYSAHTLARQFKTAESMVAATGSVGSGERVFRLSVFDRDGAEHAVVASAATQSPKTLAGLRHALDGLVVDQGVGQDELLAALAQIVVERLEQRNGNRAPA